MNPIHPFLKEAIDLSRIKMQNGEGGPFGAIIARGDQIIARGWNRVTSAKDPTAHAEVEAIRKACQTLDSFSLKGCRIYSSCEPCPMCFAAIYWARLDEIIFAATHEDAAQAGFDDALLYQEISLPVGARSLPMQNSGRAFAQAVFKQWSEKSDKVKY